MAADVERRRDPNRKSAFRRSLVSIVRETASGRVPPHYVNRRMTASEQLHVIWSSRLPPAHSTFPLAESLTPLQASPRAAAEKGCSWARSPESRAAPCRLLQRFLRWRPMRMRGQEDRRGLLSSPRASGRTVVRRRILRAQRVPASARQSEPSACRRELEAARR